MFFPRRVLTPLFESYYAFELKMSTYRNLVFKKLRQIHRSASLQIKSYLLCTIHAYSLFPIFYADKQSDDLHSIVPLLTEELKPRIAKLPAIAEVQTNLPGTHFVRITVSSIHFTRR